MQEIQLKSKNYLLVEVPKSNKNFSNFYTSDAGNLFGINNITKEQQQCDLYLNLSNCIVIGIISEIVKDEDICKVLVEGGFCSTNGWFLYEDYLNENDSFVKATDSFQSWTESIDLDLTKSWALILKV